jgi:4-oxalocrotonate tautomerase
MPIVHVDLLEGRPPERIESLIREVSQAVAHSLDAPIESVRVIVNEMQEHQYGVGGQPWPEVKRARHVSQQEQSP